MERAKKVIIIFLILFLVSVMFNAILIRYSIKNICYINYILRLIEYDNNNIIEYKHLIRYKVYEIPPDIIYYFPIDALTELYEID